ncbi:SHOCT domain-containing protein [Leuconostoc mesenteroides]|uniref:SHOCT domain-containing protein n=1 Tax=Leuconostoc mesenteroides TaxID=1245 RepID=UPI00235E7308|nr:hypothetical protein [Leuconostoc mesenteroides]
MSKKLCAVCGKNKVNWLSTTIDEKTKDKICDDCLSKIGLKTTNFSNETIVQYDGVERIKTMISNNEQYDYKTRLSDIKKLKQKISEEKVNLTKRQSDLENEQIKFLKETEDVKLESEVLELKRKSQDAKNKVDALKQLLQESEEIDLNQEKSDIISSYSSDKNSNENDAFEEIIKYKQLLDEGIISEQEFNLKKNHLLKL